MSLNIVVRYPTGREDHVAVGKGRFVVGSSKDCDIVVSDSSVDSRHLVIKATGGVLEVENATEENTVWLNEEPISGRSPFVVGDRLRIGNVGISVLEPFVPGLDETKSPDGTWKMRESINRDIRSGWQGYRRVVEKLSCFISPDEAKVASERYASGCRIFLMALCIVAVGGLAAFLLRFMQWYHAAAIIALCMRCFSNSAVLFLVGRYRMSFAGRIFLPLVQLLSALTPEIACCRYWEYNNQLADIVIFGVVFMGLPFLLGWIVDYGAGFVFEEKRTRRILRFSMLILVSFIVIGLSYLDGVVLSLPISWYWSVLAEMPFIVWCFVYKRVLSANVGIPSDSLFVAEIASRRSWKRVLCQILTFILILSSVVSTLSILGDDERHRWPRSDSDVLWTDAATKEEAWFWEDRGRYFKISDLESNKIFQLPVSDLEVHATSNEWAEAYSKYKNDRDTSSLTNSLYELTKSIYSKKKSRFSYEHRVLPDENTPEYERFKYKRVQACENFVLSDIATNICALVSAVSNNAEDKVSYEALCELLSDYRVEPSDYVAFAGNLGTNSVCVVCDAIERHRQFGAKSPYWYAARLSIGIESFTRERVKENHRQTVRCKTGILLIIVLTALGSIILYRRGADSVVGFWLGVALLWNAIMLAGMAAGYDSGVPTCVLDAIWREALMNPGYSLLACCLVMVRLVRYFSYVAVFSQSVLFIIICWPMLKSVGVWKRRWVFLGKILLVTGLMGALGALCFIFVPSALVVRVIIVLILGIWGWMLRRKRGEFTEIPRLGFLFFAGWFSVEVSMLIFPAWIGSGIEHVTITEWLSSTILMPIFGEIELGMLFCSILPILVLACWFFLFLKQKFLNVLSLGGIMVVLAAFVLPLVLRLFDIADYIKDSTFDNMFVSRSGMRIISAIVIVTIAPGTIRFLHKACRRFFMRNVYRMEQNVATAIEKIFDESSNKVESIFNVLSSVNITSFVFYERVSRDDFRCIVSGNWAEKVPETLSLSEQLRGRLGESHELVDFNQLPYRLELFFLSFELWRLHLATNGALLLPICLGTSVRGLLFVGTRNAVDMPTDSSLVGCINSFGLSSITPR